MLTAILAILLPVLLFLGVCASYIFYLLTGSETRESEGYSPSVGYGPAYVPTLSTETVEGCTAKLREFDEGKATATSDPG